MVTFLKIIYNKYTLALSFFVVIVVLALDYISGESIQFPIFYVFPVGMLSWKNYEKTAFLTAVFMALTRVFFHVLWKDEGGVFYILINASITATSLMLYAYFLNKISENIAYLKKSLYMLEGVLPICATCKKIRNENGVYEKVDDFISSHSQAQFSEVLCPDCSKEFYPKYFENKMKFKAKEKQD